MKFVQYALVATHPVTLAGFLASLATLTVLAITVLVVLLLSVLVLALLLIGLRLWVELEKRWASYLEKQAYGISLDNPLQNTGEMSFGGRGVDKTEPPILEEPQTVIYQNDEHGRPELVPIEPVPCAQQSASPTVGTVKMPEDEPLSFALADVRAGSSVSKAAKRWGVSLSKLRYHHRKAKLS